MMKFICKNCKQPSKYKFYCSRKCMYSDSEYLEKLSNSSIKMWQDPETRFALCKNKIGWTKESSAKSWETRRKNGTDKHSDETKIKMRTAKLGKTWEKIMNNDIQAVKNRQDKLIERAINKNPNADGHVMKNRKHKESTKILQSQKATGSSNSRYNITISPKTKRKMREAQLNRVMKDGKFYSVGKNEKRLLDEEEKIIGYPIDRNFKTIGYHPDGYCHELNRIIEVYEKHHNSIPKVFKDLSRQIAIQGHLNCEFVIIKDGW